MSRETIIITGCEKGFFPFMTECLDSMFAQRLNEQADIGVLDLGLLPEQVDQVKARGCLVVKPEWTPSVPAHLRDAYGVGLDARTRLPDCFPGYKVYLSFDADAWVQTPEFFDALVAGAKANGAAVVRENGFGVRRNFLYNRWWYGHMIRAFGLIDGLQISWLPAINAGVFALSGDAPHWRAWTEAYHRTIDRCDRINMDQHAFNAIFRTYNLPSTLAPARCNWICTLSPPRWNPDLKRFCEPDAAAHPLSVLHLAGPDKRRAYHLQTTTGGTIDTALTWSAFTALTQG